MRVPMPTPRSCLADLADLLLPWVIGLSCLASIRHPALLAHIERAGVELYRRPDAPD